MSVVGLLRVSGGTVFMLCCEPSSVVTPLAMYKKKNQSAENLSLSRGQFLSRLKEFKSLKERDKRR